MLKKEKDMSAFKIFKKLLPMCFKASPFRFILSLVLGFFVSISIFGKTIAVQGFFDAATNLFNGTSSIKVAILAGVFLAFISIFGNVINAALNILGNYLFEKIAGYITNFVNKKASKIEPINFESSETLDHINKAHQGVMGGIFLVTNTLMIITTYVPYFVFMGIYLYKLNPILVVSLFCVFIPVILNQFIRVKVFSKLENESANIRREFDYYEKCIIDREYFKETRLLGAFGYFNKKYRNSLENLNNKIWKAEKKSNSIELLMKAITVIGYGVILYLLFISLMDGKISIGAFGAVLSSIGMVFALTEELVSMEVGQITTHFGAVKNLMNFLDLEERKGEEVEILQAPSIELKEVSFSYPCTEKDIIKNISLKIEPKETIAIVGENGAGKSTLMKLILGLYLPSKGDIFLQGHNTKKLSHKSVFSNSSAVFQKFQKYKFNLRDNVSISNIDNVDDKKIKTCLDEVEIDINRECFSEGLDTLLSREFGGIDLSGGQWQRIAIARGLYNFNNLIVLDEPTAAIDPIEEGKIFNKFKEISKDKTAIIVTHRMGTVKIADRVVVLDAGEITEVGAHEEIIKKDGKYKEMYEAQSKWYEFT
ncbi:ABC transporter ATP-binding protein [Clostridium tarantellae]|uniref:ATP-binding cassette domain-containing protein n=1 Tax=Clostridium tarantellae TaxID=39493 RepID=A0A6I1MI27_9CLOT|nr:ABC transporter ATP-binding protein [Clostridium tarantellae]MPQ43206.1 ATP-binding cassette domain-containing protein [Clostridium tarantellae]